MLSVIQGSSRERTKCPLGAREGPGPRQSSVPLAILGLGAPSPLWDQGQSCFQCPLLCMQIRVPGAFVLPVALWLHLKQVPSQWNSGSDPVSLDPVPAMGFHKVGNPDMVQEARAATNKLCLSLFLNPFCSINLPLLLNTPKAKPMSQFMEVRGPIAAGCNFLLMSEAWLVFMGWLISHVHGWEE